MFTSSHQKNIYFNKNIVTLGSVQYPRRNKIYKTFIPKSVFKNYYNLSKMRVVVLISGGKDSLYNAVLTNAEGHEVKSSKSICGARLN